MLKKCVNPACGAQFRYLHQGKLFEVETQYRASDSADGRGSAGRGLSHTERCWLCDECATNHMLRFDQRFGIVMTPHPGNSEEGITTELPQFSSIGGVAIARVLIRPFELTFDGFNRRMVPNELSAPRSDAA